jgi:hypothetical protein
MLGTTPVPCVRNPRRDDLARAHERMSGLAPDHFEPQPPDGAGLRQFFVDEAIQRDPLVHVSPVPKEAHPDLHPGCLPEQRPADLARTLDEVPAKLLGAHRFLLFPVPEELLRGDPARLVAQLRECE